MKKKDLKKLCLMGIAGGMAIVAQPAQASDGILLAGGCGAVPRGNSQTGDNYAPQGSCSGYRSAPQGSYSDYRAAPQGSCGGYRTAPQGSCGGYRPVETSYQAPQGSCGGFRQDNPSNIQGGNYNNQNRNTQTANTNVAPAPVRGTDSPAGSSKDFPSSMTPAQSMNPVNNSNINTTK